MKIVNFKKKKNEIINQKSSRNFMKMQKLVLFVKKNLKTNIGKINSIAKLEIIVSIQQNIEVLRTAYVV